MNILKEKSKVIEFKKDDLVPDYIIKDNKDMVFNVDCKVQEEGDCWIIEQKFKSDFLFNGTNIKRGTNVVFLSPDKKDGALYCDGLSNIFKIIPELHYYRRKR